MDSHFPSQRQTHLEIIRRALTSRPHQPVAAPYLARITGSLAVHSRIADLRRLGLNIVNHTEKIFRGGVLVNTSTYTFVPDPEDGLDDQND